MDDDFRVGVFFGVLIAMGGSALFAALELRRARGDASFDPARRRKLRWDLIVAASRNHDEAAQATLLEVASECQQAAP